MAILRSKEIAKMSSEERKTKMKDLQFELVRSSVSANKAKAKTKEIKRAIARLFTFSNSSREKLARGESGQKPIARKGALNNKNQ
jgi:ribosomal protein L29